MFGDHTNMEVGVAKKLSISMFFDRDVDVCKGAERKIEAERTRRERERERERMNISISFR